MIDDTRPGFLLTPQELTDLCGYRTPSAQKRWLRTRGWHYELDRFGKPRILRAYAERQLGFAEVVASASTPNWTGFPTRKK